MTFLSIYIACIPMILFLGAIGFSPDSEEFLIFVYMVSLVPLVGFLVYVVNH